VVLSNHGGRQLEFSRSGIEVLVEVVAKLKEKRGLTFPNDKFQLFVDGGVRRATDVLKGIALGATAGLSYLVPFWAKVLVLKYFSCSRHWTATLVCDVILWPGRGGKGSADFESSYTHN
jgi:hypothetical protein